MRLTKIALFAIGLVLMALQFACSDEYEFERKEGDSRSKILYLKSASGQSSFKIETNDDWELKMEESSKEWTKITSSTTGYGDATVSINYDDNVGFNRLGKILLSIPSKSIVDTIYLRQYGIKPVLMIDTELVPFVGGGGLTTVKVISNLSSSELNKIHTKVTYEDNSNEWIKKITLADPFRSFDVEAALNKQNKVRKGILEISYIDDWGIITKSQSAIEQGIAGGTADTRIITFEDLRGLITSATGELLIEDDISIAGFAISDFRNHNIAGNPNTSDHVIDRTVNYKTAYIQNQTGSYGVALQTAEVVDNVIKRYDKPTIWLKGTTLKKEANPERYTVSGITAGHYIELVAGVSSDIPKKEKYINDLTDQDVYTFVTLKDCELPIRKGSFTPINEGYTSRLDYYPLLFRDVKGASAFLLTNINCPYRRDGYPLPQGSGDISGIVVHEKYERFEKNGFIGKYQIRHLAKEEINLAKEPSSSFSNVIAEWTKFQTGQDKVAPSNTGNGELSHTHAAGNIYSVNDFDLLLPTDGNKGVGTGSFANVNWNISNVLQAWEIKFSTLGMSGSNLSLQLATHSTSIGGPRYWAVKVSEDKVQWETVYEYTVPSVTNWNATLLTQMPGWKNIDVPLPTSLLGKKDVYIRLQPVNNRAGSDTSYDGATIATSSTNAISYLSIRYNK